MIFKDHVLISSIILNAWLGIFFIIERFTLKFNNFNTVLWISFIVFLIGCGLPDLDFFWNHRGHFHSIIAMCIYGLILYVFMFLFSIILWYYPVILGCIGFFSHLCEDEFMNIWARIKGENYTGKRTLKLW